MNQPTPGVGLDGALGRRRGPQLAALSGEVVRGDGRGRVLGFPTANLLCSSDGLPDGLPGGVYAGTGEVDGRELAAAVSVGRRPTFYGDDGARLVEVHLLGFSGDLYGRVMRVTLHRRLRAQREFDDVAALVRQLHEDVARTRAWAAGTTPVMTAEDLPRWAMRRASSVLQARRGEELPDAAELARAAGISKGLARRCLAACAHEESRRAMSATHQV